MSRWWLAKDLLNNEAPAECHDMRHCVSQWKCLVYFPPESNNKEIAKSWFLCFCCNWWLKKRFWFQCLIKKNLPIMEAWTISIIWMCHTEHKVWTDNLVFLHILTYHLEVADMSSQLWMLPEMIVIKRVSINMAVWQFYSPLVNWNCMEFAGLYMPNVEKSSRGSSSFTWTFKKFEYILEPLHYHGNVSTLTMTLMSFWRIEEINFHLLPLSVFQAHCLIIKALH